jgi:hypothetical protein
MELLKRIWQAIKDFFSPSKEDWKDFEKKNKSNGYSEGYEPDIDISNDD